MPVTLSQADVARLLQDPSPETRVETARNVAHQYGSGELTAAQRSLTEDILRVMMRDVESRVRAALSQSLKDIPTIPHDVALTLAMDEPEVAVPMLEASQVLTDRDLIAIVRTRPQASQVAVARRKSVSAGVAEVLADTHNETVVAELVANDGADISEPIFQKVLDEFGENERVSTPMVKRQYLPITVAERLIALVSENLRQHMVTHHELSPDIATDLVIASRERATLGMLDDEGDPIELHDLVAQLHEGGRLTSTIILRALCMGDVAFFEESLARLAGIPVANARALIFDEGMLGLTSLYETCKLPPESLAVARVAVDVIRETDYDGRPGDRERFRRRMIERVLTHFEEGFDGDNLEYLIAKLGRRLEA